MGIPFLSLGEEAAGREMDCEKSANLGEKKHGSGGKRRDWE